MPPIKPGTNQIAAAVGDAMRLSGTKSASQILGRFPAQSSAFARGIPAVSAAPLSGVTLCALGLTCAALGDDTAAIGALRQAVAMQPKLGAAWQKLAELLQSAGDKVGASLAYAAHGDCPASTELKSPAAARIEADERHLRSRFAGKPPEVAELLLREHLFHLPADVAAMRLLAEIFMSQGRVAETEKLLQRALTLAPEFAAARHLYAAALFEQSREAEALPHAERLVAHNPRDVGYRTLLASCAARTGDVVRATEHYECIVRDAPRSPELWLSYAQALKAAGRRTDSESAFRRCLDIAPATGEAYWGLQNLSTEMPAEAELAAMRRHLAAAGLSAENRFHLHYALGHALEKAGDYASSFAHYADGARIWRARIAYDADETTARVRRAKQVFTAGFLASRAGSGASDAAPIFVLGMPRAGSTLIEQILASHSAVEGTQELPEIGHIVREFGLKGGGYPECLATCSDSELTAIGDLYLQRCRRYRNTDRPYFIDKMPANWADVGLIHLILPNAKVIDARRDPMATCFAAFKKYFGVGQSFTYDLRELGRYYTDYVDLMAHVDTVLPGRVHRVHYERMVDDTEAEIQRLLDYCGLAFEPACGRFWETRRAVSTASAEQVRRPIFRDGVDQWRHYEAWLDPLKESLKRAALQQG